MLITLGLAELVPRNELDFVSVGRTMLTEVPTIPFHPIPAPPLHT